MWWDWALLMFLIVIVVVRVVVNLFDRPSRELRDSACLPVRAPDEVARPTPTR